MGLLGKITTILLVFIVYAAIGSFAQAADTKDDAPHPLLRGVMGDSFDAASDANQALGKNSGQFDCSKINAAKGTTQPPTQTDIDYCNNTLKPVATKISDTGKSIAKEQAVMGDVSRISNATAVAAVGATAVEELALKQPEQQKSLKSVAHIESIASTVSYVDGATDLALGAYALAKQQRQLKSLQQEVNKTTMQTSLKGQTANDLKQAIDSTNKAAMNHLLYGAGKMAVGFIAADLAKQNEKAAAKLANLSTMPAGANYITTSGGPIPNTANGSGVTVASASTGASSASSGTGTGTGTGTAASALVNTTGASGYTDQLAKDYLNSTAPKGASGSSSGVASPTAGAANAGAGTPSKADPAAILVGTSDVTKSPYRSIGSYEGGGGTAFQGGRSGDGGSGAPDIGSLMSAMLGGQDKGVATGINPNKMYEDAVAGRGPAGQEAGVAMNQDADLFQMVKTKTVDMLEKGRLLGPRNIIQ